MNLFEMLHGGKKDYTKLNYTGYESYLTGERTHPADPNGLQYQFTFSNGYGASVIKFSASYGSDSDLFELAVLKDGYLCYSTDITDDVLGYLSNDEVLETLEKIKNLPSDSDGEGKSDGNNKLSERL